MKKSQYLSILMLSIMVSNIFTMSEYPLPRDEGTTVFADVTQLENTNLDPQSSAVIEPVWWNGTWDYRVMVSINATTLTRYDSLFEVWINFTYHFRSELDVLSDTLDFNSIRVIEHDENGNLVVHDNSYSGDRQYEVPYSTLKGSNYDNAINAYIRLSWVLHGTTLASKNRSYCIYFDTATHQPKPAPSYWSNTHNEIGRASCRERV